jgi:hypothetical protein
VTAPRHMATSQTQEWTRAPWSLANPPYDSVPWLHVYGPENANGVAQHIMHQDRSYDEKLANARLIAAAPELYRALEDFDNWFAGFDPDKQSSRMEGRKVVIRARAALAKALGK